MTDNIAKAAVNKPNSKYKNCQFKILRPDGRMTVLYKRWHGMRARCNTSSNENYPRYGGRGIKVCKDWASYMMFRHWALSNGFSPNLTIDRINPDGDYKPDNCQWISLSENLSKKRQTRGETHGTAKLTESKVREIRNLKNQGMNGTYIAEQFGISRHTVSDIHRRKTWRHI